MITLAHPFGLSCVAEGVENTAQLERLRALGYDFVQAFHLGPPVPTAPYRPLSSSGRTTVRP